MKNKLLIILVFSFNSLFAQSAKMDTIIVIKKKFNSFRCLKHDNKFLSKKNEIYYLEKKSMYKCSLDTNNIFNSIGVLNNSYCKLYFKRKNLLVLIEEGYWNRYGFYGYYRSYYKNGKLKSEGLIREDLEVGKWIYYKTDGSVFKLINYPCKIKGEASNNKSRYDLKTAIKLYAYPTPQDSINFVNSVKGRWIKRYR